MTAFLDAQRHDVVTRLLDEEEGERHHVVVSLSGAHAYGFPSPDSNIDLKAVHVEPTARLVGLSPPRHHATRREMLDGIEVDYSSNELAQVLAGALQGNAGYVERVLGALVLRSSPTFQALRPQVKRALSKQLHRHYQGLAAVQLRELEEAPRASTKYVLNLLRTTLTGAHLLRSADLVLDLTRLLGEYGFHEAAPLVEAKRAGEPVVFDEPRRAYWTAEARRACEVLDLALGASPLPDEAPNRAEMEAWLLETRRALF
jgi:uncharacterized protein